MYILPHDYGSLPEFAMHMIPYCINNSVTSFENLQVGGLSIDVCNEMTQVLQKVV